MEYSNKKWPYTSNIIDVVRGSVVFDDINHLLDGFNRFHNEFRSNVLNLDSKIKNQKGCIKCIVRIKNSFNKINDNISLLPLSSLKYCDIKCNVLIEYNNIRIIGEIAFLLKCYLNFKKKQHSIYSFIRNEDLYNKLYNYNSNISNINNDTKYKLFRKCILSHDINKFYSNLVNLSLKEKYYILKNQHRIVVLLKQNNWEIGTKLFVNIIAKLEKEQSKV